MATKTRPPKSPGPAPAMSTRQLLRWMWRQLTSMRTALMLLLLLALAAIPGSLVPQRSVDRQAVDRYFLQHPDLAPVYDKLGLFSVYTSVWFSAVYILLMVSLLGCIVPRLGVYWRALRARPPKAPRRFDRLPESRTYQTDADPQTVLEHARAILRRKRARIDVVDGELRAENGYLREAGNLIFHCSLVVVLVGVAAGGLYGYRGNVIVTEGNGFSNTLTQYDEISSGAMFAEDQLPPFTVHLDTLEAEFQVDGPQRGAPKHFQANGTYTSEPGAEPEPFEISVNHPLEIDGTSVFLVGQGYAPVVKVKDGTGRVTYNGPVPFLPEDGTYTSSGVIKVPEAKPEQLGFQGFFLPTAATLQDGEAPVSIFPGPVNPNLGLFAYAGDLGMDDGEPQSVYSLDKDNLTQLKGKDGQPFRVNLSLGQVVDLPDGRGSIEFVDLRKFARFQIGDTPGQTVPLTGVVIGLLGLMLSLYVRPRRTWVRVRSLDDGPDGGSRTVVEVAALDRVPRGDPAGELDAFVEKLQESTGKQEDAAT
ncbi:cytochrome c biogenesis protein ResB [Solicola gregarius]|uniref:Cytochrome c biogenesis protein ResB n=1 Tax=Solicola gregarius TaxID=2908642 RepID=A0AA46TKG3_9ACTN|nr:cytochrome c biogenesis protein ResB [Solicola gregarius]UYM06925.1 cytochrome c biogenesis protein ResB [Solicola gregarius]